MPTTPTVNEELMSLTGIRKMAKMLENKELLDTEDLKGFTADIVSTFARYISASREINTETKKTMNDCLKYMKEAHDELLSTVDSKTEASEGKFQKKLDKAVSKFTKKVEEMAAMLPENGKDADEEGMLVKLREYIDQNSKEETAQSLRDKLETLIGDERLHMDFISGLDEFMNRVLQMVQENQGRGGGGRNTNGGGVQSIISTDGSVTITASMAKGKGVVNLSVSGVGVTILTATGTIDDANVDFTFVSEPKEIVINGLSYIKNGGWSWDSGTLTATLDFPVGTGGKIYGRK